MQNSISKKTQAAVGMEERMTPNYGNHFAMILPKWTNFLIAPLSTVDKGLE